MNPTTTTATATRGPIPAQRGRTSRKYRIWTTTTVDFDAFPTNNRPTLVACSDWSTSKSILDRVLSSGTVIAADDGKVTLNVHKGADPAKHPLNGSKYDSRDDADRAAYQAGLLGFMVYDGEADRFGLPTA